MAFVAAPVGAPPFSAAAAAAAVGRQRPSRGGWQPRRHVVPRWRAAAPPPEGGPGEAEAPRGPPAPPPAEAKATSPPSPPPPSLSSDTPPATTPAPPQPPATTPTSASPPPGPLRLWRVYSEEEQAADAEALDAAAAEWIGSDLNRWAWYEGLRTRRAELLGRANRETAAAEVEVGRLAEAIEELQAVLGVQLMRPPAPARRGGSTDDDDGRGGGGAGGAPPESGEELTAAGWAVVALALGLPIAAVVAVVSVVLRVAPKLFHVGLF